MQRTERQTTAIGNEAATADEARITKPFSGVAMNHSGVALANGNSLSKRDQGVASPALIRPRCRLNPTHSMRGPLQQELFRLPQRLGRDVNGMAGGTTKANFTRKWRVPACNGKADCKLRFEVSNDENAPFPKTEQRTCQRALRGYGDPRPDGPPYVNRPY